jgi:hypothetical protein
VGVGAGQIASEFIDGGLDADLADGGGGVAGELQFEFAFGVEHAGGAAVGDVTNAGPDGDGLFGGGLGMERDGEGGREDGQEAETGNKLHKGVFRLSVNVVFQIKSHKFRPKWAVFVPKMGTDGDIHHRDAETQREQSGRQEAEEDEKRERRERFLYWAGLGGEMTCLDSQDWKLSSDETICPTPPIMP